MSNSEEKKFSLKDQLFNPKKIKQLSHEIATVYKKFDRLTFEKKVLIGFSKLELKQRIERIADCLEIFLPKDIEAAITIIRKSLPEPCDPNKKDNDFGDFIYEPFNLFIARHTCNQKYLKLGLSALENTTQRFSAEYALRFYMRNFEEETLVVVHNWTKHKHYHVRRLASEGIRPALPWAGKIKADPKKIIAVLDKLYFDNCRFVTRSVANNLNDISKLDIQLVLKTLKRWQKEAKQDPAELNYMIRHALRTQIKLGNTEVLKFLGYNSEVSWKLKAIQYSKTVKIGENFNFSFELELAKKSNYIIDYIIHFNSKNGRTSAKTFKLKKFKTADSEVFFATKKHAFKPMTTRKLYPGKHALEVQINGLRSEAYYFSVIT